MPTSSETVSQALVAAYRGRSLVKGAELPALATIADGLAAQAAISRALGVEPKGWKVGVAEDGTPVAAAMPGPWLEPGDEYEGAPGADIRIEIELGLRLSQDLPVRPGRPYSRAEILDHCDRVFLGIEIVESRFSDWRAEIAFPVRLADSLAHGGFLIGPELSPKTLDQLSDLSCFIAQEGTALYDKPAVHPNGDPIAPVLAWANRSEDTLGPLRAGQVITTGSLCGGVLAPGKGDVVAALRPLSSVSLTLR
ncbi:MAG: hypothetical protein DI527_09735 [Chelatococcus sp.]|nr:MAG: hypothetical protein DI527_09735 [Chelatococcus sp.]